MDSTETSAIKKKPTKVHSQLGVTEQRLAFGRQQRELLKRQALGAFDSHKRPYQPVEQLRSAAEGRVPKLLPIKYARMAQSPFAFFRGAAPLMAADLALEPHTGLTVQLCGDAHVQNMGSFAGPDGHLVFDINDFDETMSGPWEWEVKRMATSIVLAGYESNHGRASCTKAAAAFVGTYVRCMEEFAEEPILIAARHQIHRMNDVEAISAALQQAQRATPCDLLAKYTEERNGKRIFKTIKNALWRVTGKEKKDVLASLELYVKTLAPDRAHFFRFFRPLDVGFKVVGTGSVGLRDYVVLMEGNGPKDPLFLQIKQEIASAYAPYLTGKTFLNQGERVVEGQRSTQAMSDLLLGWTSIAGHDYLVRQLNDHKGSIDIAQLKGEGLTHLANVAGELLARGHARSGDALAIKGYIGSGDKVEKAILQYALTYAQVTQLDFELFQKAIHTGQVQVAA